MRSIARGAGWCRVAVMRIMTNGVSAVHDSLCASRQDMDLFNPVAGDCDCGRFGEIRADERQQAEYRVASAAEILVKVNGLSCAVIQRSVAIEAAGGWSIEEEG